MSGGSSKRGSWVQSRFEALLSIVAVLAILGAVGGVAQMTSKLVKVDVGFDENAAIVKPARAGDVVLSADSGTMTLNHAHLGERIAAGLPQLLLGAVAAWVVLLLRGVVNRNRGGDPFHADNARSLKHAAIVALVGGSVATVADGWSHLYLTGNAPDVLPVAVGASFSFAPLFVALVLFAVAEVFRHGTQMREDLEGVV